MDNQIEVMQFHHSVFEPFISEGKTFYEVKKDMFDHLSIGSRISGNMLNAYMVLIPTSARIHIGVVSETEES